jgi:hypothetical protein
MNRVWESICIKIWMQLALCNDLNFYKGKQLHMDWTLPRKIIANGFAFFADPNGSVGSNADFKSKPKGCEFGFRIYQEFSVGT